MQDVIIFEPVSTKSRILQEALNQFNQLGLHQVGVRDIAKALKMSPGNMSYHFPKKEDLLLALLNDYSSQNQRYRDDFLNSEVTMNSFFNLFEKIFNNQFAYRGVLTELVEVNRILSVATGYDLTEGQAARMKVFETIIERLQQEGHIQPEPEIKDQLVSFISVFGRFWIADAFLMRSAEPQHAVVSHYLNVFRNQVLSFATEKGVAFC